MRYATIDDVIRLIKSLGKGCFLAKTDIKSAFRIIPVSPNDFPLLGMEWQGKFYFDKCLPMGCSSSCNIFETFSTALEWIAMNKLNASAVIHILDDFIFIAPSKEKCQGAWGLRSSPVRLGLGRQFSHFKRSSCLGTSYFNSKGL